MTYPEIKILLIQNKLKVGQLAKAIGEHRGAVSMTIAYIRKNQRIREKIAAHFKKPYNEIWDDSIQCGPANPPKTRSVEAINI